MALFLGAHQPLPKLGLFSSELFMVGLAISLALLFGLAHILINFLLLGKIKRYRPIDLFER